MDYLAFVGLFLLDIFLLWVMGALFLSVAVYVTEIFNKGELTGWKLHLVLVLFGLALNYLLGFGFISL